VSRPRFSERTAHPSTPNALTAALTEARGAGRALLDLTVSNPTRAAIPYDEAAILGALASPAALDYAPDALGLLAAREAVAVDLRAHGVPSAQAARVLLTASTSEAYSFALKALCDPGDDVLSPEPSYPLLAHLAALEGVRLTPYPLRYDGEWHVDLDALRRARGPRTRAVFVVHPNNPTGSYVKRDELRALSALGLPIVSDEVFSRYPLTDDPRRIVSAAQDAEVLTFAMSGLSKLAGLPQLKLAFTLLAGPDDDVREALGRLELIGDTFLSASAPVLHALPALLAARAPTERAIHARIRRNYLAIRALIDARSPATLLATEGGWYACMRLPRVLSEEAWALLLLAEDGVVVQPGYFFDFADEAYVVLSLLTPEPVFDEGLARLLARVRSVSSG
jgi:aspartate/methionine/tyrosine aminotransferase